LSAKSLNIVIKIDINSGAALLLYLISFFGLIFLVRHHAPVENVFPVASAALTGAFAGFLVKRSSDRKVGLEQTRIQLANGHRKEDPLT
jgi:uncharacterized membrane protein